MIASFRAEENRGYYQGREAYEAWMRGLAREADFGQEPDRDKVLRRLGVNDSMLCCLIDARRAAASYLEENIALIPENMRPHLEKIARSCREISEMFSGFREKTSRLSDCAVTYNTVSASGAAALTLRQEQAGLLEKALLLEEENCELAGLILNGGQQVPSA